MIPHFAIAKAKRIIILGLDIRFWANRTPYSLSYSKVLTGQDRIGQDGIG
jgi:hypothetical protein